MLATLADFHRGQRIGAGDPRTLEQTWGPLRVLEPIGSGAFGRRLPRLGHGSRPGSGAEAPPRGVGYWRRARLLHHPGRSSPRARAPSQRRHDLRRRAYRGHRRALDGAIDGETVEQRLDQGPLQSSDAVEIGIQICRAVAAVHKAGLLHRDIKAQNVMLAKDGRAVLMDFGTGWDVGDMPVPAGSVAGTPLYLAPELFRDGEATIASDVYSLGVLLYHMVTGTYPVRASNLRDLRLAHERHERADVHSVRPAMPPRLARIIARAIDPRPDQRYHSADALAVALAGLQPRPAIIPMKYAAAAAAALVLGGWWLMSGRLRPPTLTTSAQQTVSVVSRMASRTDAPAIAVLPMKNRGSESGSEEFMDGFTEEIINNLAANEHLQVRSRASSFVFKNRPPDLQDVGRQLDVSLVLEGSGQRSGRRFQVEARLVRTASGVTLMERQLRKRSRRRVHRSRSHHSRRWRAHLDSRRAGTGVDTTSTLRHTDDT